MTGQSADRNGAPLALIATICLALAAAISAIGSGAFGHGNRTPLSPAAPFPGFTAEATSQGGLVVTSVKDDSAAQLGGLLPGDRITEFNMHPVSSLHQAEWLVRHRHGDRLEIGVVEQEQHRRITVQLL